MNEVQNKVVAITGASSGIGEAIARHLSSLGATVVIGARRTERLDAIVADIEKAGGKALALAVDVTRRDEVKAFVDKAVETFGRLDVLVNNAGIMPLSPLAANLVDEWDSMVDVNIKGVLYGISAALPVFQSQNSGHLINVSSVAGHLVFPGAAVYCGTKFAVRAITEGFRQEAGPNIRSTIICPGAVQSELAMHISHKESSEAVTGFTDIAIGADAIARAVGFAIGQPADVDVNEMIVRPTAQTL